MKNRYSDRSVNSPLVNGTVQFTDDWLSVNQDTRLRDNRKMVPTICFRVKSVRKMNGHSFYKQFNDRTHIHVSVTGLVP